MSFLLLKFALVGLLGVMINFSSTWILKDIINANKYFSNATGYSIAMTFNFILNKIWTFSDGYDIIFLQILKFLFVISMGVLLNHLIVFYFHEKNKLNFYFSKLIAVAMVFVWNFSMHSYFTFNYFK
tara:strand:+ start:317 stop:697 length:381 start_codon:yes stop_codon:yes gene_type:complete